MKTKKLITVLTFLLASGVAWTSQSFAGWEPQVEGLTVDEAEKKYGVESGSKYPLVFEVNAESGPKDCAFIPAAVCSKACPTAKIFYQSPKLIPNNDGTKTMKVDIYYDVNEVAIGEAKICDV
ncbi:MAG: hypothetical protein D3909_08420 [Candidatus Electrothrix sp. ATG1]|nr:hypothetical protein [Candidatus Electrothrix sp. ATG1]MCI5210925.1 hypothetical protein [Candidatus Electrothrix sp. ATG2]